MSAGDEGGVRGYVKLSGTGMLASEIDAAIFILCFVTVTPQFVCRQSVKECCHICKLEELVLDFGNAVITFLLTSKIG